MPPACGINMPASLRKRLLDDIAEMQQNPYPNCHMFFDDSNIQKACLILTPEDQNELHLSIAFPEDYPLRAPTVTIQSYIAHPNVFGDYICATILNRQDGWTPAYTLKGIVIQLLSFFCSDSIEQDYGGYTIDLAEYQSGVDRQRRQTREWMRRNALRNDEPLSPEFYDPTQGQDSFSCQACGFGPDWVPLQYDASETKATKGKRKHITNFSRGGFSKLLALPDEITLLLLGELETRDVLAFADAIPTIKSIVYSYDFIRVRELQCFCLKKSFTDAKLGIGVAIKGGRRPVLRSEFDLISQEAFFQHDIRHSVHSVPFDKWLPLPLSRGHWRQVKGNAAACLQVIENEAHMPSNGSNSANVLYNFMNNIVVQFSADAEMGWKRSNTKSTLNHASEKAVEAYFSLFHLLLCLATENNAIVAGANDIVARFIAGPRNKAKFADLGHVLVAALISDAGLTENLTFLIIKEAILRNVVWMLDGQGANMAELAYLEPGATSNYRLVMTYHASSTSYRLLMFLKLFSSAARPQGKPLVELREALFDTHGAPPPGVSEAMAQRIREIREVNTFPVFLKTMGIEDMPSKSVFTAFLRRTITDSVKAGYSVMPINQSRLYMMRRARERHVEVAEGVKVTPALERWFAQGEKWVDNGWQGRPSFFPNRDGRGRNQGRGQAGFRGRGR